MGKSVNDRRISKPAGLNLLSSGTARADNAYPNAVAIDGRNAQSPIYGVTLHECEMEIACRPLNGGGN
jgi:hypothetical protein